MPAKTRDVYLKKYREDGAKIITTVSHKYNVISITQNFVTKQNVKPAPTNTARQILVPFCSSVFESLKKETY